MKLQSFALY